MKPLANLGWLLFNTGTAMVGYQIHHSVFWAICDWIFSPITWVKWLICHEVSVSIIKSAFSFFLQ